MKTPEQNYPQEDKMEKSAEGKEALQPVVQILKETAEKFRSLDHEADMSLAKKDTEGYKQKLQERAQLLVALPGQLENALGNVDPQLKRKIEYEIQSFATEAQERLEGEGLFGLGALLTHMGDKIGDKNDLEKLIDLIENE